MPDTTKTEFSILDRCSARQIRELLSLASAEAKTARNWLLEIGDLERMECLLTEICAGTEQSGAALLRAACSPDTPLEVLVAVKSTAKHMAAAARSPVHQAAATLLYHLSVASGLGRHGQNISSKHPAERLPLYKDLAAEISDDDLAAIFEKAVVSLSFGGA